MTPVAVFLLVLFCGYPLAVLLLLAAKAFRSRQFLLIATYIERGWTPSALIEMLQKMIWRLRFSYNPYDLVFSKALELWFFKVIEAGLLTDDGYRRLTARAFRRIFFARSASDPIVQARVFTGLLRETLRRVASKLMDNRFDGRVRSPEILEQTLSKYIEDLRRVIRLVTSSKPLARTEARLVIDSWIENGEHAALLLPGDYLTHLFILKFALAEADGFHIKHLPSLDVRNYLVSFPRFLLYGPIVLASQYWLRAWGPIALFLYRHFPHTTRPFLAEWTKRPIVRLAEFGIARSPSMVLSAYSLGFILPVAGKPSWV